MSVKDFSTIVPSLSLNSGKSIPHLGLGLYLTGTDVAPALVKEALEIGYRHIDGAALYKNEAETAQGVVDFLAAHPEVKRSEIFYTTKVWGDNLGYEETKASLASSWEKLKGLGYIDLVLVHSPIAPTDVTLSKDDPAYFETQRAARRVKRLGTWKALQEAVEQGLIKTIGVSNYNEEHLKELYAWEGLTIKPAVNQIEVHPWLQRESIAAYSQKLGLVVEAYSPLTRGKKLVEPLDPHLVAIAAKYKKTPVQVLLRWSVQHGYVPLPKSTHRARLIENIDIWDFELTPEELELLGDKNAHDFTSWDPLTEP
ncbi:uncharacterized protein SAPINGB_P003487 [Magnusiomyces paraingens]|uniref:NADP-dependent oxidoreductase domain-containing protein n=1 Tax=Magnusiomyces paraingens TaxID=2606893 RepID=A0A5E8BV23_9ASCO|nr:uncharacterized protein SAPINGB_P003487 [Saprochaete ingens]VVT53267.1 unnamed protein product [Saprochaete ingens]